MRSRLHLAWLVAALLGCGGSTLHPTVTLDGTWQARLGVVGSSVTLVLAVQGGSVTGTGSYAREAGRNTYVILGSDGTVITVGHRYQRVKRV